MRLGNAHEEENFSACAGRVGIAVCVLGRRGHETAALLSGIHGTLPHNKDHPHTD